MILGLGFLDKDACTAPHVTTMAKLLRRLAKRRDAASTAGKPEQPTLETEDEEARTELRAGQGEMESKEKHLGMQELLSRTEPKARLTAIYSYSSDLPGDLSFQ